MSCISSFRSLFLRLNSLSFNNVHKRFYERPPFVRRMTGKKLPRRKHIWFPTAPSKLYDIPERIHYEPWEEERFTTLESNFKDSMRSLSSYLYQNVYLTSITAGGFTEDQVRAEQEEQSLLLKENSEENKRQRLHRETMTQQFKKEIEDLALAEEMERLIEEDKLQDETEQQIEREIERSKTYITKDTLEEAIEKALERPVSYEYALDLSGRIIGATHPYALDPYAIPESSGIGDGLSQSKNPSAS